MREGVGIRARGNLELVVPDILLDIDLMKNAHGGRTTADWVWELLCQPSSVSG